MDMTIFDTIKDSGSIEWWRLILLLVGVSAVVLAVSLVTEGGIRQRYEKRCEEAGHKVKTTRDWSLPVVATATVAFAVVFTLLMPSVFRGAPMPLVMKDSRQWKTSVQQGVSDVERNLRDHYTLDSVILDENDMAALARGREASAEVRLSPEVQSNLHLRLDRNKERVFLTVDCVDGVKCDLSQELERAVK